MSGKTAANASFMMHYRILLSIACKSCTHIALSVGLAELGSAVAPIFAAISFTCGHFDIGGLERTGRHFVCGFAI